LSFRSEAKESAVAVVVALAFARPFCLSFRSAAKESAVAVVLALVFARPFCLSFRSEAKESAATFPPSSLPLAGCQSIIDKNNVMSRRFGPKDERAYMPALKAVLRPLQERLASNWAGNMVRSAFP
jgi:hypothetical protein